MAERNFAIADDFTVPVDEITGIRVREGYERSKLAFGLGGTETVPGKFVVFTEDNAYSTTDPESAKKFVNSLGHSTNVRGARADDLIRKINNRLS